MGMPLPWRSLLASLASLGFHLCLGLGLMLSAGYVARPPAPPAADVWSGSAVEVDSIGPDQHSGALADQATGTAAPGEPAERSAEPARASTAEVEQPEPAEERPNRVRPVAPPNAAALNERAEAKPEKRKLSAVEAALAAGEATFRGAQGSEDKGDTAPAASPGPASFGGEGLPPGVRHLPKAFARALPEAGWRDSSWRELPLGDAGELVFDLPVDEQGKLGDLVYVDAKAAQRQPAALRRMVERCVMMLRAGTYSLAPSARESGRQRLKVEARLSQGEASDEGLQRIEHNAPAQGRPGRGVFTLDSGLRMEARIWILQ